MCLCKIYDSYCINKLFEIFPGQYNHVSHVDPVDKVSHSSIWLTLIFSKQICTALWENHYHIISFFSMLYHDMSPCYGMPVHMTPLVMIKWPTCMSLTLHSFVLETAFDTAPPPRNAYTVVQRLPETLCAVTQFQTLLVGSNIVWCGSINRPTRLDEYSSRGHVINMAAFSLDVTTYALVRTRSHPIPNCWLNKSHQIWCLDASMEYVAWD